MDGSLLLNISSWIVQLLPSLWLGLLIGVSFVATPVKFQAASLTLPVALDVGRETFHLLNMLEWIVVVVLVAALWISGVASWRLFAGVLLLVIVALQTFWLLPTLDARVEQIIGGVMPPPTYHHIVYSILEVTKAIALVALSISALVSLRSGNVV